MLSRGREADTGKGTWEESRSLFCITEAAFLAQEARRLKDPGLPERGQADPISFIASFRTL